MNSTDLKFGLERVVAIGAVREAARLCRAVGAEIAPEALAKKDKSPVTVADFGSQALICRTLAEAFPDDPIIAEEDSIELRRPEKAPVLDQVLRHVRAVRAETGEGNDIEAGQVLGWIDRGGTSRYVERFWTLDPIDGTKGFLRGEQYAVALALVIDGRVVVAALACPNLSAQEEPETEKSLTPAGAIFWAVLGGGAYDESGGLSPRVFVRWSFAPIACQLSGGSRGFEVLRVGRVGSQCPRGCGGHRRAVGNRRSSVADGQPGEICRGRSRPGRSLSAAADPGRLPREDLGSRRRRLDRLGGRRHRHRHHRPASRVQPWP